MNAKINRRSFLRGSGALIALPSLASMNYKAKAGTKRKSIKAPKRAIFISMGFGVTQETWFPDLAQKDSNYTLPLGLKPLAKHKSDFTIVQGCRHEHHFGAHNGSTNWLTGANRYAIPGQNMSNSISLDQVIAGQVGHQTRFSSLPLVGDDDFNGGHGPGLSLSWDQKGKPIGGIKDPVQVFHKLFSAEDMPLEQRQAAIAENRSVLDTVFKDAKRVQGGLSKDDNEKLDEYFQGIRDIETRLKKDEDWLTVPKAKAPMVEPKLGLKGKDEIEMIYKLMTAALQTDSTRAITYRLPVGTLLQSVDAGFSPHTVSHYAPGPRMEASQKRDKANTQLLAGLIDQLKRTKEADGSSLFDNTTVVFGGGIRSIHYIENVPTLITGRGSNLKLGHNLVLPEHTPLCNVWLSLLQGMGIKADSHGDSTGIIKELQA
ncbi:DUF1552 domain-containing protein [Lentisphaera marina]|uniref:DUF1552 domain-containing protein n=1 Tax=Lentisphaera marina TaxID=1111041 RepID=UPI00236578F0|nr:DUF1552 domain-containing protein [Lentisphaera marina]MDD7985056.1 DUF1552 domain-containing protein [Lentisphaera marina]